jgi:hypothetical protein
MIECLDSGPAHDLAHPIPRLDTIDTELQTDRGAYIGIVIAAPLKHDPQSKARLLRKVALSLSYFESLQFLKRCGEPRPDRCRIYISVHSGTDSKMLEIIDQCGARMLANGITPVIELTHLS